MAITWATVPVTHADEDERQGSVTIPADRHTNRGVNGRRRLGRRSGGFTLVELLIATTLIMVAMGAMMLVYTSALAQTAGAKQRQVADSVLTKTMEQVRALPYATIAKGLDNTASLGDGAITYSGANWTYNSESVVPGALGYQQAPLNNPVSAGTLGHKQTVTVNNSKYTVAVYPTFIPLGSGTQQSYRVTVVVSWKTNARTFQVSGQTLVYSPQGCLSTATHPFGAPCQPFFYSSATTGIGSIQVIPAAPGVDDAVDGIDLERAQILFPEEHATLDVEQITKVLAKGVTSGAAMDLFSGTPVTVGSVGAAPQADTDPASLASPFSSNTLTQIAGSIFRDDGSASNANWISATASPGDTGTVTATAVASGASSPPCKTVLDAPIGNSLPCSSTVVQQNGTSSIQAGVYWGGHYWGAIPLASVDPSGPTRLSASRWTTGAGLACAGTSGVGCVNAAGTRRFGTIRLAGLPAEFIADVKQPLLWAPENYLVELSNYGSSVSTEAGIGAAAPAAQRLAASGLGFPTLKYWNGAGYTTVNWSSLLPPVSGSVTLPPVTVTDDKGSGNLTVTISGGFTFGTLSTTTDLPAGCATLCTTTATAESPLKAATINYLITRGGTTLANLVITVDLADLKVSTKYQAAPSAS